MKNPKLIATIQALAGILMLASGLHNLNYFEDGLPNITSLSTVLSLIQLAGGPTFLYLAFKTATSK